MARIERDPPGMIERERSRRARECRNETQIWPIAMLGNRWHLCRGDRARAGCRTEMSAREHERLDRRSRSQDFRPRQSAVCVDVQLQRLVQIADIEIPLDM